jgi:hypothetical protein
MPFSQARSRFIGRRSRSRRPAACRQSGPVAGVQQIEEEAEFRFCVLRRDEAGVVDPDRIGDPFRGQHFHPFGDHGAAGVGILFAPFERCRIGLLEFFDQGSLSAALPSTVMPACGMRASRCIRRPHSCCRSTLRYSSGAMTLTGNERVLRSAVETAGSASRA